MRTRDPILHRPPQLITSSLMGELHTHTHTHTHVSSTNRLMLVISNSKEKSPPPQLEPSSMTSGRQNPTLPHSVHLSSKKSNIQNECVRCDYCRFKVFSVLSLHRITRKMIARTLRVIMMKKRNTCPLRHSFAAGVVNTLPIPSSRLVLFFFILFFFLFYWIPIVIYHRSNLKMLILVVKVTSRGIGGSQETLIAGSKLLY